MISIRRIAAAILTLGVWQSIGCTSDAAPKLQVAGARILERSDEALVVGVQFTVENRNDATLPLGAVRYSASVNGTSAYRGRRSAQASVPPREQATIELPLVVPYARLGWSTESVPAELSFTIGGELEYGAPSKWERILFESGIRQPKVSFSRTGRVTTAGE